MALVQRTRENASDGDGALLIRTDFDQQQVWDDLCELIRKYPAEGLLTDLLLIDDSCYEGATAEQLLNLVPDDAGYPYIAIADAVTAELAERPQDRSLLIVDSGYLDDEDEAGGTLRALVSEFPSIDANLSIANMEFGDYAEAADVDGVFRGF
ncbi:hypothetical protein ABZX92_41020 [Lentzea sp. NPDC006480]|uniref:DUF6924 domain-containing protein n=1 Tax=Lentzea sp. NPDC006480 TaxID=3157176 RepID=UPI00339F9BEB